MKHCPTCGSPIAEFPGVTLHNNTVSTTGNSAHLSASEYAVFDRLLSAHGRAVTRETLMDVLYGLKPDCDEPTSKIIDVFVCRVRRKLKPLGLTVTCAPKIGWWLEEPHGVIVIQ